MPTVPTCVPLDEYLAAFRPDFRRKERAAWARVYVEGLLAGHGRRTIEGICRAVAPPPGAWAEDARQALQNFIQESPWDEAAVWSRLRRGLWPAARGGALVVDDVTLVKQGRHSVGVHRQLCADRGKKLNCQVVSAVFLVADGLAAPLAMRLYLPHAWHAAPDRLDASKVPAEFRRPCSRVQVALDLLAALRADDVPVDRVVAGDGYRRHDDFRAGAARLGFAVHPAHQPAEPSRPDPAAIALGERVGRLVEHLKDRLGLDHFEGRSWRGLHHHLCLVALAYGSTLPAARARTPFTPASPGMSAAIPGG